MADPRDEVQDLAAHILDQGEVDWTRVSVAARRSDPEAIDGLRLLEDLARGFRHTLVGGDATAAQRRDAVLFRFAGLEVRERLGRGGQGEVYRAYDPLLDQDVALKLRPAGSDTLAHQFIAEARRLVRVRHANVVSVYGAAMEQGRVGLWMELVRGETLAQRLASGRLTAEEVVAFGAELCAALAAVHRHGLVHGDVKAENVLCEAGGRVVLADFGAAREVRDHGALSVSGTLHYLAPELLQGAPATPASDLYALGVLMYRALAGTFPRQARSLEELLHEHATQPLPPLRPRAPGVPAALAAVVERCLDADPRRRPRDATALARQLEAALAAPPRRGVLLALAGGLAAAALAAVLVWPRGGAAPEWQAELLLYRLHGATPSRLGDGEAVQRGDGLQLVWRSDAVSWLYVLDDDGGGAAVLFPVAGLQPGNPLPAATAQTLPRDGAQPLAWTISGDNAQEDLLVIAARRPQPRLDAVLATWQHSMAPAAQRGATTLAPAALPPRLDSAALRQALDAAEGEVRTWRFRLPHAKADAP